MRWRRAKRDATHAPIVKGLRALGWSVVESHAVGGGFPDAIVGGRGLTHLLEFKRPGVAGRKRGAVQAATNEAQARFADEWRGGPVHVVSSLDEALAALKAATDGEGF